MKHYLKRKYLRFKLRFRKPARPFRKPMVLEGLDCQTLTNTSQTHTHKPMVLPIPTLYPRDNPMEESFNMDEWQPSIHSNTTKCQN